MVAGSLFVAVVLKQSDAAITRHTQWLFLSYPASLCCSMHVLQVVISLCLEARNMLSGLQICFNIGVFRCGGSRARSSDRFGNFRLDSFCLYTFFA